MDKKLIEKLFIAREEYRKLEKEIYSLITKPNYKYTKLNKNVKYSIGIKKTYTYSNDFKQYIKDIYESRRIKDKLVPKESFYIKFLKNNEQ
jgi:hypothetical protein